MRAIAALFALWFVSAFVSGAETPPRLKYVVIISRHGVRAPTWNADRLHEYSSAPWPNFGVPPGNLTAHGRTLMKLMGTYYAEWLSREQLVNRNDCGVAARVHIWADTDERTLESAKALAGGMLPDCQVPVHSEAAGTTDPLFDPIAAGVAVPDNAKAVRALRDRLDGEYAALMNTHRPAFDTLQQILVGDGHAPKMVLSGTSVDVSAGAKSVELSGPFSTASTLSENLLLEYANGFRDRELGWGRLDSARLLQVLELHAAYADLLRRTPYLARLRGSNLLSHVLDSMTQAVTAAPIPGALGTAGDALLVVSGHDTNLSNISGMLGLTWSIPGYPRDDTPPGGALIFSLWTGPDGPFVRTEYVVQTLEQMREATPLSMTRPPARVEVTIPGCATKNPSSTCSWDGFARAVRAAIDSNATSYSGAPRSLR
ncbi:MAG TPA: histidine-type phosphatase [Vicinamibacterales bacterium]|nr:histidine-type phosphatase [Vicinamibacterales bacterium]